MLSTEAEEVLTEWVATEEALTEEVLNASKFKLGKIRAKNAASID